MREVIEADGERRLAALPTLDVQRAPWLGGNVAGRADRGFERGELVAVTLGAALMDGASEGRIAVSIERVAGGALAPMALVVEGRGDTGGR